MCHVFLFKFLFNGFLFTYFFFTHIVELLLVLWKWNIYLDSVVDFFLDKEHPLVIVLEVNSGMGTVRINTIYNWMIRFIWKQCLSSELHSHGNLDITVTTYNYYQF